MTYWSLDLSLNLCRCLNEIDEPIKCVSDSAFQRILDRHHSVISLLSLDEMEYILNSGNVHILSALTKLHFGCKVCICFLRTKVSYGDCAHVSNVVIIEIA